MFVLLKKLADWFCSQGKKHASLKSVRGSYEAPVPQKLQKLLNK